ncbi:MAG: hypothetical protein MUE53_05890 [Chitinophagales bacterium]|nr:hypothetical protein [Chitinophagales bacterium]
MSDEFIRQSNKDIPKSVTYKAKYAILISRFLTFNVLIGLLAFLWLSSCSTSRNKGLNQSIINFVSYYNTYFNIKDKYKTGYKLATKEKDEKYINVLSVFPYDEDPELFKPAATTFAPISAKTAKIFTKYKKSRWVDDAILYNAKKHYHLGRYDSAAMNLEYILQHYPKGFRTLYARYSTKLDDKVKEARRKNQPVKLPAFGHRFARYEAVIWLARTYTLQEEYTKALSLINNNLSDMSYPVQYREDLNLALANVYIHKKEYQNALPLLTKMADTLSTRAKKGRIHFILGQINALIDKPELALIHHLKANDFKLSQQIDFENAILIADLQSANDPKKSYKLLKSMLSKGKYSDRKHKIHLSLAKFYLKERKLPLAKEHLALALAQPNITNYFKFQGYDLFASYFIQERNHITAAYYIDSAKRQINFDDKLRAQYTKKSQAYDSLLHYHFIYLKQDSIYQLISMGREKAIIKIAKEIKAEKKKLKTKDSSALISRPTLAVSSTSAIARFYFDDELRITQGKKDFIQKYGKIKRQDFWYRAKPSSFNESATPKELTEEEKKTEEAKFLAEEEVAKVMLGNLDFSEENKDKIKQKLIEPLVNIAEIYRYDILDTVATRLTYNQIDALANSIPEFDDLALFNLYQIHKWEGQIDSSDIYKNKLLSLYPLSKYAKYILNPKNRNQDQEYLENSIKEYAKAFYHYKQKNYTTARDITRNYLAYADSNETFPRFKLLLGLCYSYTRAQDSFVTILENLTQNHKATEQGIYAQELLDILSGKKKSKLKTPIEDEGIQRLVIQNLPNEELIKTPEAPEPKVNYYINEKAKHAVLLQVTNTEKIKDKLFVLDSLNLTAFMNTSIKVKEHKFRGSTVLSIEIFDDLSSAKSYLDNLSRNPVAKETFKGDNFLMISNSNFDMLRATKAWGQYLSFYSKNY